MKTDRRCLVLEPIFGYRLLVLRYDSGALQVLGNSMWCPRLDIITTIVIFLRLLLLLLLLRMIYILLLLIDILLLLIIIITQIIVQVLKQLVVTVAVVWLQTVHIYIYIHTYVYKYARVNIRLGSLGSARRTTRGPARMVVFFSFFLATSFEHYFLWHFLFVFFLIRFFPGLRGEMQGRNISSVNP